MVFASALFFIPFALAAPATKRLLSGYPIDNVTPAQWAQLNRTVGGKLGIGYPWARPCYAQVDSGVKGGTYDGLNPNGVCAAVQAGYTNDSIVVQNFGGYINNNWEQCQTANGQQCNLNEMAPAASITAGQTCYQGSVPDYYVDVRNSTDVQAVFAFAKQYNVPLTVKNSGHDYKGRSAGPKTLAIWTHNIQYINRNKKFVGAGCPASNAVDAISIGAGNNFLSLYQWGEANNATVLGGSSETVGASGGWILGGGHSSLSNLYGLGVDRVQQFKVVTPQGQFLTVSACQNTDLWFALRGGGGAFAVILETTFAILPRLTIQAAYFKYVSPIPGSNAEFLKVLIANALKWADEGWGGYIEPGAITSQAGGFVLFNAKLNNSAATASMAPVFAFGNSPGYVAQTAEVVEVPSFFQAYQQFLTPNEELTSIGTAIASRLLLRDNFATANAQSSLLQAIQQGQDTVGANVASGGLAYSGAPTQILVTAPSSYTTYKNDSAVTPAWRQAVWHILFAPAFGYQASAGDIAVAWQKAHNAANPVRAITPNSGAYQNEADIHEPNWQQSFYGMANYNRLVQIKKTVDPNSLLNCWNCPGFQDSDRITNSRYMCYP